MALPPSNDFATKDYITLGLAAWGALVSTFVVVRQLLQAHRRIQVQIVQHLNLEEQPDDLREHWRVRVVNVGSRPLEITRVGLIVKTEDHGTGRYEPPPRGFGGAPPDRVPPFFLNDGETATLFFKLEDEGPYCDVRGAVALDATNREHLGFLQMRGHEHLSLLRTRAFDRLRLRLALRRTRRKQNNG